MVLQFFKSLLIWKFCPTNQSQANTYHNLQTIQKFIQNESPKLPPLRSSQKIWMQINCYLILQISKLQRHRACRPIWQANLAIWQAKEASIPPPLSKLPDDTLDTLELLKITLSLQCRTRIQCWVGLGLAQHSWGDMSWKCFLKILLLGWVFFSAQIKLSWFVFILSLTLRSLTLYCRKMSSWCGHQHISTAILSNNIPKTSHLWGGLLSPKIPVF